MSTLYEQKYLEDTVSEGFWEETGGCEGDLKVSGILITLAPAIGRTQSKADLLL